MCVSRTGSSVSAAGAAAALAIGAAVLAVAALPAWGQAAFPADARGPIEALTRSRDAPPAPLTGAPDIPMTSQAAPANAAQLRFTLRGVEFAGGTIYPVEALEDLWRHMAGREVSVADVFAIAAAAQARYRADGYLFNRVIVPAQKIEDGTVRLEMIEAVLESVEIEAPGAPLGPVEALAERIAAPLRGLRNPTLAQIERVLLLLDDIPGVVRAAALPKLGGETRGGVRLFINMEREAQETVVFADNRQSPLVGRGLIGAVHSWQSYSAAADSTTVSLFGSADFDDPFPEDFKERWTAQLEHRRFLDADGLQLSARGLWSRSRPGGVVRDFHIEGEQLEGELRLTRPFLRGRALSIEGWGGIGFAEVDGIAPGAGGGPDIVTADDSLRVAEIGLAGTQRDALGGTEMELRLRAGLPWFGASEAGDEGLSRADGDGRFALIRARASRSLAPAATAPFSFWVELSGQWADRALLSTEEFSLGGASIARAYDPSEASGDIGAAAAVEIRYAGDATLFETRIPGTLYAFADGAEVRNLSGGAPGHQALVSMGFGLRAGLPQQVSLNLEAALPVNEPTSQTRDRDWRFFFSLSKQF